MSHELADYQPYWKIGDLVMVSQPIWFGIEECTVIPTNDGHIGVVIKLHSVKCPDKGYLDWLESHSSHHYGSHNYGPLMEASLEFIYNVYVDSSYEWYRASELIEVI